MAGAEIRAGRAYVELMVHDRLAKGLRRAAARLKAFGATVQHAGIAMMTMGSALTAPLLLAAKTFASMGDQVAKMSQRTGFSTESLSALGFAAEQSGTNIESLEKATRRMAYAINQAGFGLKSYLDIFGQLGLTYDDLKGKAPEEQFLLIMQQLEKVKDASTRAAIAMQLFGRAGTSLLPMISKGAGGLEGLRQQARDLGLVISQEDAAKAAEFTDTMNILWRVIKQGAFTIGASLAPMLMDAARWITKHVKLATDWIGRNRGLVVSILKLTAGLIAAGAGITVFGLLLGKLGAILGILASAVGLVGTVLGAMLTPMGLVMTAAVALGGYLLWTSGAGGKALSWLGEKFNALKQDALKAWKGIGDALAAGDIALAAKILWLTLKMEWLRGTEKLKELWVKVKEFAWETWYGIQAVWEEVVDAIVRALINGVAWMKEAWVGLAASMRSVWETTTDWLAKRFLEVQGLFDKDLDVKLAKEMVDVQAAENARKRQAETAARLAAIDQEKKDRLAAAEEMHQDAMSKIGDELAAVKGKYDNELKAAQDAVDAAKKEWKDALQQAADERSAVEGAQVGPPEPLKVPHFDLGPIMSQMKRAMSVRGTFNIAAIQGLMGGDAMDRTADATEETAENTRKMRDQLDGMEGLAFE